MTNEYLLGLVTVIVTLILGVISKRNAKISNKLIPVQNLIVGVIVAVIQWIITKDFNTAIALSGLIAGGAYDIVNNLNKLKKGE